MSEPSSNGETIGGFDNGQKVTIIKNLNNGWLQVKYQGNIGYVVGKYIKY